MSTSLQCAGPGVHCGSVRASLPRGCRPTGRQATLVCEITNTWGGMMASIERISLDVWRSVETWPLPASLANQERLTARRAALQGLDAVVRRQLQGAGTPFVPRTVELTVYDAIYAGSPEVGGHWTAATAWFGLLSHAVSSVSVALVFDEQDRPRRFQVNGARSVASTDVSESALATALAEALSAGPATVIAPHVF